ncbi:MAG: PorV/PorQ family protein [bacterium]
MKTYKTLIFGAVILCPFCAYSGVSELSVPFLLIFPDARQNGMAGVFTGVADDALATYYNDAGMAFQQKHNIAFTHMNLLPGLYPGIYYETLSSVFPIFKPDSLKESKQAIGVNVIWLHTGTSEGTDNRGNEIGPWGNWDFSAKVSYANRITKKFSVGAGVKYIYSFLCPVETIRLLYGQSIRYGGSGQAFAFDFSGLYVFSKRLQLGLSVQNLGSDITYIEAGIGEPLPRILRAGISYKPNNKLVIAGDITKVLVGVFQDWQESGFDYIYRDTWKGIGLEYTFYKIFSARWGYFSDITGKRSGPTFGLGIKVKGVSADIALDSRLYEFPTENWTFSFHYCF